MDYGELTRKLVADAIQNKIPGLNKKVDFKFFVSAGEYDPEEDTTTPVFTTVADVVVVAAKPTYDDVKGLNVIHTDVKLVVPGTAIPQEPQVDTDKVIFNGDEWNVRKCVGVPGGSLYLVFIWRT